MDWTREIFTVRVTSLLITLILVTGCGFYTIYQGSKPVLSEESRRASIVKLDGVDLNIRPYNDVRDFQMVNSVILVPVYISGKDEAVYGGENEFFILLAYRTYEDGFTLAADRTWLLLDDERFDPTVEYVWTNPHSKWGDEWTGFCGAPIPETYQRISYRPSPEKEADVWHCYKLKFGVSPPAPSKKFGLKIEGMSKSGTPYQVPVIWFEEYIWHHNDSVP